MSTLFPTPDLEPSTIETRPYQVEALHCIRERFRQGDRSTIASAPMGTGKTIIAAMAARASVEKGNRTLVIAHLTELINQTANTIERVGIVPGVEQAESKARCLFEPDVVVGSVQTLQGDRLESWDRDYFKLIIIDECHHAPCPSYQKILQHFSRARVLGLTATIDRADGILLEDYFDSIAYELSIFDAMLAPEPGPYLCGMRVVQADVGVDLRALRPSKHDYSAADLERRIAPLASRLAKAILKDAGDRQTMVFTPGVDSASGIASALRSRHGVRADWVAGDSPDRDEKIAAYRAGDTQFLVSCQLLLEGFDAPATAAIALCQPTKSRARMCQMIGRGLRLHRRKETCTVIDFDYLTATHSLARPADLFADQLGSREAISLATEYVARNPGLNMLDVVERARERTSTSQRGRREIDVRIGEGDPHYLRRVTFDPLSGSAPPPPPQALRDARHDTPTERMVAFLKNRGHKGAGGYSRRYAGRLIGMYKAREAS